MKTGSDIVQLICITESDETASMSFDANNHEFMIPKKEIGPGPDEIPKWEKSEVSVCFKWFQCSGL